MGWCGCGLNIIATSDQPLTTAVVSEGKGCGLNVVPISACPRKTACERWIAGEEGTDLPLSQHTIQDRFPAIVSSRRSSGPNPAMGDSRISSSSYT